jgi:hypothetical protein
MEQEVTSIRQQTLRMSWHMRGGATYEDILQMSINERNLISELIKSNLETTKTSRLPYF